MNQILKIVYFLLINLVKMSIFVLFSILSEGNEENSNSTKSIYLLDENGNEFIDDGVTFGYELDNSYEYRNRP